MTTFVFANFTSNQILAKIYSCEKKPNITLLFYRSAWSLFSKFFLAGEFFKLLSNSKPTQKLKLTHDVCKVNKKLRCTYKISEISAKSTYFFALFVLESKVLLFVMRTDVVMNPQSLPRMNMRNYFWIRLPSSSAYEIFNFFFQHIDMNEYMCHLYAHK